QPASHGRARERSAVGTEVAGMSKVGWLRVLVANLVDYPLPNGVLEQEWLDSLPIVVGMVVDDGDKLIGIKSEAHEPLDELANGIHASSPAYQRGFPFERIRFAVLEALVPLYGRPAASIGQAE